MQKRARILNKAKGPAIKTAGGRNMKKTIKSLQMLLAVAGVVAVGATAGAQTETQIVTNPTTTAMVSGTLTFVVPQFNPALGTLNSVDLTLTPAPGSVYPSDYSLTTQTITDASVNDPNGSLTGVGDALGLTASWSGVQNPLGQSESISATPGLNNGAPQTFAFTTPAVSLTGVNPAGTGFVGLGNDNLSFTTAATATSFGMGAPSVTFVGWNGTIGGTLEVTYNYTVVPEPSTISLVVAGLLGVLGIRRRKA